MSRRHDQSYKLLFSLSLSVEHLIRGFISERLADELDFGRTENLATERTTPGLVRSQADLLWKVHFRGSSRHLLLPIEFQSEDDRYKVLDLRAVAGQPPAEPNVASWIASMELRPVGCQRLAGG